MAQFAQLWPQPLQPTPVCLPGPSLGSLSLCREGNLSRKVNLAQQVSAASYTSPQSMLAAVLPYALRAAGRVGCLQGQEVRFSCYKRAVSQHYVPAMDGMEHIHSTACWVRGGLNWLETLGSDSALALPSFLHQTSATRLVFRMFF